jgi:hypothetical protein
VVIKVTSPFKYLNGYRVILVTGCQRTGTNIAAQMIAHDLKYNFTAEEVYDTDDAAHFDALVAAGDRLVIHCPAMMHRIHEVTTDDIAVVVMQRPEAETLASMERIRWQERGAKAIECAKYGVGEDANIYRVKYATFDKAQRRLIPNLYDVRYSELEQHVMWQDRATRQGFTDWQTRLTPPSVLIVTLGYRHYGQAMVSHALAAEHLQACGVRFDWLHAYGVPDDLRHDLSNGHEIVTRKYQQAREQFLAGNYNTFIAIEDDMLIPEDTFSRLLDMLKNGADVAYGLYCWRHSIGGGGWSAYTTVHDYWGESVVIDKTQAQQAYAQKQIIEIAGVGLGCTAIQRHVLETIPFTRRGQACNDWYFAVDCQYHDFVQRCDMGLVCGHMTTDPSPRILWPDISDMETMQRIEYL